MVRTGAYGVNQKLIETVGRAELSIPSLAG